MARVTSWQHSWTPAQLPPPALPALLSAPHHVPPRFLPAWHLPCSRDGLLTICWLHSETDSGFYDPAQT